MPRPAHHSGTDIHIRGLSSEKICVPCAIDRNGMSFSRISNTARVKTDGLDKVFENHLISDSKFVVDKANAYKKFAQNNGVKLIPLKGVSSKYLNNYLIWNNFVNYSKEEYSEKKKLLLRFVLSTSLVSHSKEISNKPALPVLE